MTDADDKYANDEPANEDGAGALAGPREGVSIFRR